MSENPSLDDENIDRDAPQFKRQTSAKTIALLRREKIVLEERLQNINDEIATLLANDG